MCRPPTEKSPKPNGGFLRKDSGEYKVIDAKIEGVSMSLTLREEFNAVISRVGIEGLILELQRRAGG